MIALVRRLVRQLINAIREQETRQSAEVQAAAQLWQDINENQ